MNISRVVGDRKVQRFAVAGLTGGIVGHVCASILTEPTLLSSPEDVRRYYAWYFLFVVTALGAFLIAADARLRGVRLSTELVTRSALALPLFGLASGYLAQVLYENMLRGGVPTICLDLDGCITLEVRIARMLGWGLAGLLGGVGVSLAFGSRARGTRAALGGLVGGLLGGLLFDIVGEVIGGGNPSLSRLVGLGLIGLLVGGGIAVSEVVSPVVNTEPSPPLPPPRRPSIGGGPLPPAGPGPSGVRPAPPRPGAPFGSGAPPQPPRRPNPPPPPRQR